MAYAHRDGSSRILSSMETDPSRLRLYCFFYSLTKRKIVHSGGIGETLVKQNFPVLRGCSIPRNAVGAVRDTLR